GAAAPLRSQKIFEEIISLKNLFLAWQKFKKGKRNKLDIQKFEFNLEDNLFQLHHELKTKTYQHSYYTPFNICDPKPRKIHKAIVKDRVLHHAVFRILYPIFDKTFIYDSYSCRLEKGTHKAVNRLEEFKRKLSRNNRKTIFALKCDIKKFFDSIDQDILLKIIQRKIKDKNAIWLIEKIIMSFKIGLPLGNVTSQIFANIYLNELDQFVKHNLKIKYYIRYCDDFIILNESKEYLNNLIKPINDFLNSNLKLNLHSNKIVIRKYSQGIDFLGYVVLPYHRVLRTKTKKRILKKIKNNPQNIQSINSYLGVLKHCKGYGIEKVILDL
ncbi:MAG: reverse transcriptase domain-containing protein, partial [Patescibacteria group bacterium]